MLQGSADYFNTMLSTQRETETHRHTQSDSRARTHTHTCVHTHTHICGFTHTHIYILEASRLHRLVGSSAWILMTRRFICD